MKKLTIVLLCLLSFTGVFAAGGPCNMEDDLACTNKCIDLKETLQYTGGQPNIVLTMAACDVTYLGHGAVARRCGCTFFDADTFPPPYTNTWWPPVDYPNLHPDSYPSPWHFEMAPPGE
jgi:hypothetical protein